MHEHRLNILITGGTGSLGSALARHWYPHHNLTILSREIHKQEALKAELPDARFVLADICDYDKVCQACRGQDVLIHAAAAKNVFQGEQNPGEYARINVMGTEVVARAWRDAMASLHPVTRLAPLEPRKAILIGTDKQVAPINVYGHSKAIATSIFLSYGYSVVRYGNVMSSNGSFLPIWQKRIKDGLPLKVRTPNPTRFILSLTQAIALIEDALKQSQGFVYIPHSLPAIDIKDVAVSLGAKIEYESLLPGEKQHETLLGERELAEEVSDLLARVVYVCSRFDRMELSRFNSATARRMSGEEVLEWLQ
jgi:UDP-N-acetylglucosamine 4,6-dehydratase